MIEFDPDPHRGANPYAPPLARVQGAENAPTFFVVSPAKVIVLYVVTLGLYPLFWFYMHWTRVRAGGGETIWPVVRAVFSVFYVHAFARRIEQHLQRDGIARRWWPMKLATLFVALEVLNYGSAIAWP